MQNDMNEPDRIWAGDDFRGTTIVYAATPYTRMAMQCDYLVSTLKDTFPGEVRASRKGAAASSISVPSLGMDRLQTELMVIVGPDMSADDVVASLQNIIDDIRSRGLLTEDSAESGLKYEYCEARQ